MHLAEGRGKPWALMEGYGGSWKVTEGHGGAWKAMEGHGRVGRLERLDREPFSHDSI